MGCGSSSSTKINDDLKSSNYTYQAINNGNSIQYNSQENPLYKGYEEESIKKIPDEDQDEISLTKITLPKFIYHTKSGNTICFNGNFLIFQDGPTTIEYRAPPKFQSKRIPWRYGLIRDIVWCSQLDVFIILTKDTLFALNPIVFSSSGTAPSKEFIESTIDYYDTIKPYDERSSFWRCTCADTTLYISYSGFGSVIDEYLLSSFSAEFINRWTPPKTCAIYEGIWCIRYHSETDELGFAVMDARNNQWRLEVHDRQQFKLLWQIVLPLTNGDCEICPLPKSEWLAVNSCGIRLIQISNQKLKAAVEYERELRNTLIMNDLYFAIRTKNTVEIHQITKSN